MRIPATLRALGYRNFQLFFAGQLISLIGTWMQNVAQAWLVYKLSGSSMLLGAIGFASQIPIFLFAPPAGIIADRYNRRLIVIGTQSASMVLALILAALTLTGTVRIWHIFVLSTLLGIVNSFDIPVRQSFIVEMVGKVDLMNALALNSSMFNASRLVGPALAGILVAHIGEGWCFFVNGVSYVAVLTGLVLMKVERHPPAPPASAMAHLKEGFRFVSSHEAIRALLLLLGVVSLTGMPYIVLMPIMADRVLHGGPQTLGWLMGVSGAGALSGALLLASRTDLKRLGEWVPISATAFGLSLIAFSLARTFWLSAVLLLPVGFSMMIEMGASNTLIQSMVPDRLRGRVLSAYSMMLIGMGPIGSLIAGAVADRLGAPVTVAAAGVVCLAAAAVFWIWRPAMIECDVQSVASRS